MMPASSPNFTVATASLTAAVGYLTQKRACGHEHTPPLGQCPLQQVSRHSTAYSRQEQQQQHQRHAGSAKRALPSRHLYFCNADPYSSSLRTLAPAPASTTMPTLVAASVLAPTLAPAPILDASRSIITGTGVDPTAPTLSMAPGALPAAANTGVTTTTTTIHATVDVNARGGPNAGSTAAVSFRFVDQNQQRPNTFRYHRRAMYTKAQETWIAQISTAERQRTDYARRVPGSSSSSAGSFFSWSISSAVVPLPATTVPGGTEGIVQASQESVLPDSLEGCMPLTPRIGMRSETGTGVNGGVHGELVPTSSVTVSPSILSTGGYYGSAGRITFVDQKLRMQRHNWTRVVKEFNELFKTQLTAAQLRGKSRRMKNHWIHTFRWAQMQLWQNGQRGQQQPPQPQEQQEQQNQTRTSPISPPLRGQRHLEMDEHIIASWVEPILEKCHYFEDLKPYMQTLGWKVPEATPPSQTALSESSTAAVASSSLLYAPMLSPAAGSVPVSEGSTLSSIVEMPRNVTMGQGNGFRHNDHIDPSATAEDIVIAHTAQVWEEEREKNDQEKRTIIIIHSPDTSNTDGGVHESDVGGEKGASILINDDDDDGQEVEERQRQLLIPERIPERIPARALGSRILDSMVATDGGHDDNGPSGAPRTAAVQASLIRMTEEVQWQQWQLKQQQEPQGQQNRVNQEQRICSLQQLQVTRPMLASSLTHQEQQLLQLQSRPLHGCQPYQLQLAPQDRHLYGQQYHARGHQSQNLLLQHGLTHIPYLEKEHRCQAHHQQQLLEQQPFHQHCQNEQYQQEQDMPSRQQQQQQQQQNMLFRQQQLNWDRFQQRFVLGEEIRMQAEEIRKQSEEIRKQSKELRMAAEEQRREADAGRKEAERKRREAEETWPRERRAC